MRDSIRPIENKYDFVLLFDVTNGNPNGDPDMGNEPRHDIFTNIGYVTDVCLKHKVRNYVDMVYGDKRDKGMDLYIRSGQTLNDKDMQVACCLIPGSDTKNVMKQLEDKTKGNANAKLEADRMVGAYAREMFYDVRTFGAVMTSFSGKLPGCSQQRGPVQIGFARSVDPIDVQSACITRVTEAKADAKAGSNMGRKPFIPYGLYVVEGHVGAALVEKVTKGIDGGMGAFTEDDLAIFWDALMGMFEMDASAARAQMVARKLVIFKHASKYGSAPAHKLIERVKVEKTCETPLCYEDYKVTVDGTNLPAGVTMEIRE